MCGCRPSLSSIPLNNSLLRICAMPLRSAPPFPYQYSMPYGNIREHRSYRKEPIQGHTSVLSDKMPPHLPPVPWGRYRRFRRALHRKAKACQFVVKDIHICLINGHIGSFFQNLCHGKLDNGGRTVMPDTSGNLAAHRTD